MSRLLAEFVSADTIAAAAHEAKARGFAPLDALTPYPVATLDDLLGGDEPRIRVPMALCGFGVAIFAFLFQWWSAAYAYPFNSGGRPLLSWPVFLLVPFEVGVLAAAIAGMIAFFLQCGLPRLHHPVFDIGGIARASQDRFFLVFDHPDGEAFDALKALLLGAGAVAISEAAA